MNKTGVVASLLNFGAPLNECDAISGATPLMNAAKNSNIPMVDGLLPPLFIPFSFAPRIKFGFCAPVNSDFKVKELGQSPPLPNGFQGQYRTPPRGCYQCQGCCQAAVGARGRSVFFFSSSLRSLKTNKLTLSYDSPSKTLRLPTRTERTVLLLRRNEAWSSSRDSCSLLPTSRKNASLLLPRTPMKRLTGSCLTPWILTFQMKLARVSEDEP